MNAGATTWYRYDLGWNSIVEYADSDNDWAVETRAVSYTYTHGQVGQALGQSVGKNPGSGAHASFTQDRLGSTRGSFDSGKARVAKLEYGAYGEQALGLGDVPSLQFTGKIWDDAIDMYYFPYRYYSPDSSRWLTNDPLGMVDGSNMYSYVKGNPISITDPFGLYCYPDKKFLGSVWLYSGVSRDLEPLCGGVAGFGVCTIKYYCNYKKHNVYKTGETCCYFSNLCEGSTFCTFYEDGGQITKAASWSSTKTKHYGTKFGVSVNMEGGAQHIRWTHQKFMDWFINNGYSCTDVY